ncbi:hypothetical protein LTR70_007121 [Exophiala xenobiotica]|uniref:Uncharacterized protein n=1 Tax=Lithohypha guttulata TaxID=1690604 RepID=A0ABR0K770_9EURO|nr:hypothetical protein LTR24_006318 [Lithohypha guttulata]KAK5314492.1 hypothetical protein LTR70_007121 [Exophiala xenobiotica]
MTAEVVPKKRGRPKKVVESPLNPTSGAETHLPVTTSKQSTKWRSLSTTEAKAATPKKTTRRKQVDTIEDASPAELEAQKASKPSRSVAKSKASKSTILDEATAFSNLKQSPQVDAVPQGEKRYFQQPAVADGQTQLGPAEQVLEALQLGSAPSRTTPAPSDAKGSTKANLEKPDTTGTDGESIIKPRKPASESSEAILEALQSDPQPADATPVQQPHQHATAKQPVIADKTSSPTQSQSSRGSFLSTFLDDKFQEAAPIASENNRISDRSAFNTPQPSVEDIVSGAGVSDLSSYQTSPSSRQKRPPKTLKPHTLSAFEHGPHESLHPRRKTSVKQVEPETFAAGSFKTFKAATSAPAAADPRPSSDSGAVSDGPFFTQATSSVLPAQASVADQPAPSPSRQPQARQQSPPHPNRAPPAPVPPRPASPPSFPPRKPTQMTYAELRRNRDFRALRRRWTGVIVGVPVLIVTSYVLWNRLDVPDALEGVRGERAGVGRVRGVPVAVQVGAGGGGTGSVVVVEEGAAAERRGR